MKVDGSDNIYVFGNTRGSWSGYTNAGEGDLVLMKLDGSDGSALWAKQRGSTQHDWGNSLELESWVACIANPQKDP